LAKANRNSSPTYSLVRFAPSHSLRMETSFGKPLKWGKAIHLHDYSLLQPATKQPYFAHFYPSAGAAFTGLQKVHGMSAWMLGLPVSTLL
ncbi:hypothetical protein P9214_13755, partial [Heyndrickxia coagulans]|uniref:hypothetical protein n=1 Tax=Heyndrickxia coagulans TaxID=1398 RepID=UPI002E1ADE60|nr:hypothetical protein [Heyndrickxia coagulans]